MTLPLSLPPSFPPPHSLRTRGVHLAEAGEAMVFPLTLHRSILAGQTACLRAVTHAARFHPSLHRLRHRGGSHHGRRLFLARGFVHERPFFVRGRREDGRAVRDGNGRLPPQLSNRLSRPSTPSCCTPRPFSWKRKHEYRVWGQRHVYRQDFSGLAWPSAFNG